MAKSMTKSAIIAHLAQKTDLSKKQVNDVMDQLLSLATKEAKNVFVADGGPFVSQANKNLTWTIIALSWRTSEYIAEERRKGNI